MVAFVVDSGRSLDNSSSCDAIPLANDGAGDLFQVASDESIIQLGGATAHKFFTT